MSNCDVAIIGSGPYGLSIAAHLNGWGIDFRIFGYPMHTWLTHMPKGMHLKSEGFASSLSDPGSTFTLEAYCKEKGIPYSHIGRPVPLQVFSEYGLEFQRRFVGSLEKKLVESLRRTADGFYLHLEDGSTVSARRVVIAAGLTYYANMPSILAALPKEVSTHSREHHELDNFKGREVAIVGAGASAIDLAALLVDAGAQVQVIARKPRIRFHDPPGKDELTPSLFTRMRHPVTGIGPGWKLYFYANAPLIFRHLPQEFRFKKVQQILGPAPCWFTKEQVVGKIPLNVSTNVTEATVRNGRVSLRLSDDKGSQKTLEADHVIAATGYKVDLRRLTFLDAPLLSEIRAAENTPILSSQFESSISGLYFVGTSAANTFGPLLRFAFGSDFAARRLSKHLAASAKSAAPADARRMSEPQMTR